VALPNVITFNLNTTIATNAIASALASTSGQFSLNGTYGTASPYGANIIGTNQQRIVVYSAGNDSGIYFHIVGLNQAGFTVQEYLTGALGTGLLGSAGVAQSQLDYLKVLTIQPSASSVSQSLATTAATVSVGLNGVGSTMWQIMNWHVSPTNIEVSGVVVTGGVNWGCQYTYDDPNNLPAGTTVPQAFNHPTLVSQTTSLDGPINDPVTAARFIINSNTGTLRGTIIQAGVGSP
jgi:hypothetical protein